MIVVNRILEYAHCWAPCLIIAVWCLWAVNWRVAWPVLASGGWIGLALVAAMTAYVWALMRPNPLVIAGITLPNLPWKLGAVGSLVGLGLFCGWLQGVKGWEPEVVDLEPPAHGHHDDHHGHH